MRRHLDKVDEAGPSAFKLFRRLLSAHFDRGDHGRVFDHLQTFGVPTGIAFPVYLRDFRELTAVAQGTEKVFKPSDPMVLEIVRTTVNRQYPALTPASYPRNSMTAVEPFASVSAMWFAFDVYATNKTPAINGEIFFSFTSPGGHTTLSSSPPSSASTQQTRSRNSNHAHQGTARNLYIMPVASAASAGGDVDPLTVHYNNWPLEHFREVFSVSHTFSTSDPPLWCPLLTTAARLEALRVHSGQCLNCRGRDYSVKTCRSSFINSMGVLNPVLGRLDDGGYAFQQ